ncbi:hypothetical protein MesoLj113b_66520 [Mesorhizobium sp. 113-3-3]|nr:hypothetical protein MesoLj113b_66520 [Mesorhizobium sp. 113-3-3]
MTNQSGQLPNRFFTAYQVDDCQETVAITENRKPPCQFSRLVAEAEGFGWFAPQCRIGLNFCEPLFDIRFHRQPYGLRYRKARHCVGSDGLLLPLGPRGVRADDEPRED